MKISEMNWMQVEAYLERDDRAVLPLGSTEQHAYLSLSVDSILAEKIAVDAAAEPGVPVFPVLAYGMTPYFGAYPGTVTVRMETYVRLVRDLLDSLLRSGFKRILIVNGHGGNAPVEGLIMEWMADNSGVMVKFHNWWRSPRTWAAVQSIDPVASHASWMENFPWTRLPGVVMPETQKPLIDLGDRARPVGDGMRAIYGDGNYGGYYQRSDDEVLTIWQTAVADTRTLIEQDWD
ncbi:MAG: creatininase family protein [Lysobacterales bacterium]